MSTNPYEPPVDRSEGPPQEVLPRPGRPCDACGSRNTRKDRFAKTRLNIIYFFLFGWLFMLINAAFTRRADYCLDCGGVSRYRTAGSWIAMLILFVLGLLIIMGLLAEGRR